MPENLRYKRIFRETFNLLSEYETPSKAPEYWECLAEKVGDVCGSLGGDPLAVDILAAIYADLERRAMDAEHQNAS